MYTAYGRAVAIGHTSRFLGWHCNRSTTWWIFNFFFGWACGLRFLTVIALVTMPPPLSAQEPSAAFECRRNFVGNDSPQRFFAHLQYVTVFF